MNVSPHARITGFLVLAAGCNLWVAWIATLSRCLSESEQASVNASCVVFVLAMLVAHSLSAKFTVAPEARALLPQ